VTRALKKERKKKLKSKKVKEVAAVVPCVTQYQQGTISTPSSSKRSPLGNEPAHPVAQLWTSGPGRDP
jgi:hypothetical protein